MLMSIFDIFVKQLMVSAGELGGNNFGESMSDDWHLLKRIGATERDAKRASDFGVAKADGSKNVGFGGFIGSTGGTSRNQNSLFFELINQAFGINTWER